MNGILQVFKFEGQGVRVVEDNAQAWFCVRDVGAVLGLKKASENVRTILRVEELNTYSIGTKGVGSPRRNMLFTNESGLYTLIMRSRRPEAVQFRVWVTDEVLPTIRRTGSYALIGNTEEKHVAPLTMSGNVVTAELSFTYSYAFSDKITPKRFTQLRKKIEELISAVRD